MKWRKLGRIFEPRRLGDLTASHAAVPIAQRQGEHRWRVFYTTRDHANRSHTAFFDLDPRRPGQLLGAAAQPVLSPGALGTFDEDGVMGSWVVGGGDHLLLFYTGWNRGVSVPFRNAIGLAESRDGGHTFVRVSSGPLLDRGVHDPVFAANPCVLVDGGLWRMWYLSGLSWEAVGGAAVHRYHVKYADSGDGREWRRQGRVCIDLRGAEIALSRPCVLRDGDRYRMWYSRRGESYRIGYAESSDGVAWTRLDERAGIDVSPDGWDAEMVAYAHVFDADGERYMLYNGNGYGATGIGMAVLEAD
jgi:hypothetical protein